MTQRSHTPGPTRGRRTRTAKQANGNQHEPGAAHPARAAASGKRAPRTDQPAEQAFSEPDKPAAKPTTTFAPHPGARARAADLVYESLSRAILNGQIAPGSELPPQRELSNQFDVSPLVVRQAMHRLEDLGLLRVRQGGATTVLDPNSSSDLRLLQQRFALAKPGDALALAALESQALFMLQVLVLAQRRITEAELAQLEALVHQLQDGQPFREVLSFRLKFSDLLARSTRNPLFIQNVRWWSAVMLELEARSAGSDPTASPRVVSKAFYFGLIKALRERRGAVDHWQKMLKTSFDWSEAQPAHPVRARQVSKR